MSRFCANCGTEVDENAAFCPTCGQPIDQADEVGIPPAPAWPEPSPPPAEPAGQDEWSPSPQPSPPEPPPAVPTRPEPNWADERYRRATGRVRGEEPTRVETAPPPAAATPPPGTAAPERPSQPPVSLPFTMPVTLSAWLIGGGALLAAVGAVLGMFEGSLNPLDLLLLLLLIGIAVTVFFSASVPAIPHLRLATLVVALIGFGMALDRIGFGGAGAGALLLFIGTAAAGIGCILLELGRDAPLGGSQP